MKLKLITFTFTILSSLITFGKLDVQEFRSWDENESNKALRIEREVSEIVNKERAKIGAPPLKFSPKLSEFAAIRAKELPIKFSHTRPDGSSCFTAIKMRSRRSAENIACGQRSPSAVMRSWMNSKGHRRNILSKGLGQIGVGHIIKNGKHYWVQLFTN